MELQVPLTLQGSTGSQGDRRVKAQMEMEEKKGTQGKSLHLRLTDPTDPLLFYALILTEEDFLQIKSQQGLLVDFAQFPNMLRQLAEQCAKEEAFSMVLREEKGHPATIEIREANVFRHLCHLSLKVCRGTDGQIKEYLAEGIKRVKEEARREREEARRREEEMRGRTERAERELREKTEKLERLTLEAAERAAGMEAGRNKEVALERETMNRDKEEMRRRHEEERREMQETHAKTARQAENRIVALDYENKDLMEKKHRSDAQLQRLTEQLKLAKEDLGSARSELQALKTERDRQDAVRSKQERESAQSEARLVLLEQENVRLKSEVADHRALTNEMKEHNHRLENEVKEKVALVQKRENAVRNVSTELLKANEIIRKFQDQTKAEHAKVKLSAKVIEEQEKVVGEKDSELNTVREELRKVTEKVASGEKEKTELEDQIKRLQEASGELDKKLRTNEAVIHWLNKQLNVAQSRDPGLRLAPPPEGLTTFTPSGMRASSTPMEGGRTNPVVRSGATTSQEETLQFGEKENQRRSGLDERYLQSSDILRPQNGPVLPSNIRNRATRGGLLRKPPPAAHSSRTSNSTKTPEIESVYFPRT